MKKIMWIIAMLPMLVTAIVYQYLPEEMPMHYNFKGEIDRWGGRSEKFIFPVIILGMALFWYLFSAFYEKKAKSNKCSEKESAEAVSNAKVLSAVGLVETVMFGVMHFVTLYSAYVEANTDATNMAIDVTKLINIMLGIVFIIFGNIMPKTKKNRAVGVRTGWSMYNDNTWRKSNRFGGIVMLVTGSLSIVTSVLLSGGIGTMMVLVYLIVSAIVIIVYSKRVYERECKKV